MKLSTFSIAVAAFSCFVITDGRALTLGPFEFNDEQFGDALLGKGGLWEKSNWLNTVNTDPGKPAVLTGPNVETGIANIGLSEPPPTYVIEYNTPIVNGPGEDLGIISARFSSDFFSLAVSTDGTNFTPFIDFKPKLAVDTGVTKSYFYDGGGPFEADLFVTPVDLSWFGIDLDATVSFIKVTSFPEGDLIRVAGFAEGGRSH